MENAKNDTCPTCRAKNEAANMPARVPAAGKPGGLIVRLSKAQSVELIRRARQKAVDAVERGLRDPEAYRKAQEKIESHRDLRLDKLVVTR